MRILNNYNKIAEICPSVWNCKGIRHGATSRSFRSFLIFRQEKYNCMDINRKSLPIVFLRPPPAPPPAGDRTVLLMWVLMWGHNTLFHFCPGSFLGLPGLLRIIFLPVIFARSVRNSLLPVGRPVLVALRRASIPFHHLQIEIGIMSP